MVGKNKKRGPPKEGGLPIPKVPPPTRRRESPRRSGSSVQEHSNDRFILPTSPQADNEGDTGNTHVSPHDKSLDSQVNNDVASDSVVPELLFNWRTQLMTSLVPIQPQTSTILQDTPEALPKFNM
jgi:hypothetical protein